MWVAIFKELKHDWNLQCYFSATEHESGNIFKLLLVVNIRSLVMFCVVALFSSLRSLSTKETLQKDISQRHNTEHSTRPWSLHQTTHTIHDEMETWKGRTKNQLPLTSQYPQCNLAAVVIFGLRLLFSGLSLEQLRDLTRNCLWKCQAAHTMKHKNNFTKIKLIIFGEQLRIISCTLWIKSARLLNNVVS